MKITRVVDAEGNTQTVEVTPAGKLFQAIGSIETGFQATESEVRATRFLAPLLPTAILCIGLNYRQHANESKLPIPEYPVLFMKLPNAAIGHQETIQLPIEATSNSVDYECELAVVIGKRCRNVSVAAAFDNVFGYTCANDVSARDWQIKKGGSQWCRGKTFDTFCPLGPHIVSKDEFGDPQSKTIRTSLNGERVQDACTDDMIFGVAELISFLSQDTTLEPGTVILTGTPHGVGFARKPPVFLKPGDTVSVEISDIGTLTNLVK